jgi:D-lactate dehydrogenase (cytochrome)
LSRPRHRAVARAPSAATVPPILRDPDLLQSFLSDAAHVPGGTAGGVLFPADVDEVAAAVSTATRVLPVGAQSSLTGGATPRGDVVLSTRRLSHVHEPAENTVRVGAGVPLAGLQQFLAARGLYYPPVPTFDGAFVGGTVATNAAGAATFKYGVTRDWVAGLTVVLADGSILELARGDVRASDDGSFEVDTTRGLIQVAIPTYQVPRLPKVSAGYFTEPHLDLVDLFVGSEGTLAVIVDVTLRVKRRPVRCVALIACSSEEQAIDVATALRVEARLTANPLDIAAIEYMDAKSLSLLDDATFARAGVPRPVAAATMVLVQIETEGDVDVALARFHDLLQDHGVEDDPVVALPEDERTATRLFELREAVPATVNARVGSAQAHVDRSIQKMAGDFIVPFDALAPAVALYRDAFERRGLQYAIWGHISDGNLHPNVIPRSVEDVENARDALREMARGVMALGGAPLAEHGVGRNPLKQQFLREMYGEAGIEQMRAVKRALDPDGKLAAGVLFPEARYIDDYKPRRNGGHGEKI